jgi:hypothetical protein
VWWLAGAMAVLLTAAWLQTGSRENQIFFSRLTPLQEQLQHMRTAYVWVSSWWPALWPHYLRVSVILAVAYWRVRGRLPADLRWFVAGMPIVGLLSVPLSYLLLEHAGWALVPQLQPARALLFVVLMMQVAATVAAIVARHPVESFVWFVAAYAMPLVTRLDVMPPSPRWTALAVMAALAAIAVRLEKRVQGDPRGPGGPPHFRWALAGVALAGFWIVPGIGQVVNYPSLQTPELARLSDWARGSTSKDAVFLFADVPRSLDPGVFRATALRAVYCDWKSGGQVNYLKELGEQWWFRWQQTLANHFQPGDLLKYDALGIHYVVLQPKNRLADRLPEFENARYLIYRVR